MSYQRFIGDLRRNLFCRFGWHGSKQGPDGQLANFCRFGCGHAFNTNALKSYLVTTKTGEQHVVLAVNTHHARSMVIYGASRLTGIRLKMNDAGKPVGEIYLHPDNIVSVELSRE